MKRFVCFKLLLLDFALSGCSSYLTTADSRKSLRNYTVVLSMDGFRWDYPDSFPTPNLHKSVWKKNGIPESLHFGSNVRIDDLVIAADSAWSITLHNHAIHGGAHGYDLANTDMHAIFFACGPDFKKNYRHPAFRNIHLYLILAKILSIHPVQTDGDLNAVKRMLR